MNKLSARAHTDAADVSANHARPTRARSAASPRKRHEPPRPSREPGLASAERRLLEALNEAGACAFPDPHASECLIVKRSTGSVSLGGGRHSRVAAQGLVARDLAAWQGAARLCITAAGSAHLRRFGGADRFAEQHRETREASLGHGGARESVKVNNAESPLAWLRARRGRNGAPLVDDAGFEAGERLRRDLTFAGMIPGITLDWRRLASGAGSSNGPSGLDPTESCVAARQRVRAALEAVGGQEADLLVDLCGFLKGLTLIERERGWPSRSGKVVLGFALSRLAAHYGISAQARGPERSRRLSSWRAA